MIIPDDIALWIQRNFEVLASDDFSLAYFASGNMDRIPDYSAARWQLAVDTLYRLIRSGLLKVHQYIRCSDEDTFFEAIRTVSPYGGDGMLWNGTLVYGTPKLDELFRAFFTSDGSEWEDLNPRFIEALEQIFADNGVPWSDKPLLPIAPSEEAAAAR